MWEEEHSHEPHIFQHGNTTGGRLEVERLTAAVELLITTKEPRYRQRINELFPTIEKAFNWVAALAVRALPLIDASFAARLETRARAYRDEIRKFESENPFGVPITTGGWAGSGQVVGFATTNYHLHKAFPEIIGAEDVYRGLHFVLGCHPGSNLSWVSGVGTDSKSVAYGFNRADYSFIPGGVVPGVLILPPDFPENKEDWPFLWGENEYVINVGAAYIFLVNAVNELVGRR